MDQIASPILNIPRIGYRMGAMSLAEIRDFSHFDSPGKILAYAGVSPSPINPSSWNPIIPTWKSRPMPFAFCSHQYRQVYLSLGWNIRYISSEEDFWRKAFQHCHYSCHKETCAIDLCNEKIRHAISEGCITVSVKSSYIWVPIYDALFVIRFSRYNYIWNALLQFIHKI